MHAWRVWRVGLLTTHVSILGERHDKRRKEKRASKVGRRKGERADAPRHTHACDEGMVGRMYACACGRVWMLGERGIEPQLMNSFQASTGVPFLMSSMCLQVRACVCVLMLVFVYDACILYCVHTPRRTCDEISTLNTRSPCSVRETRCMRAVHHLCKLAASLYCPSAAG